VIERVLPADIAAVDTRTVVIDPSVEPAESSTLGPRTGPTRRQEFALGRRCAELAQRQLTGRSEPILPGSGGAPQWPRHLVGSITHCDGFAAAAVGFASAYRSLGIDAEVAAPVPADVEELIMTTTEYARIRSLDPVLGRVIFSAKESVYKARFPLTGEWLDFADLETELDLSTESFVVHLDRPSARSGAEGETTFAGRFLVSEALILTAVALV